MHSRLKTWNRLKTLYESLESMRLTELRQKTAALREVERSIEMQHRMARSARFDGRDALVLGDRMSWEVAEVQRRSVGSKLRQLDQIHVERESLNDEAREQYVASRIKSEQMKSVAKSVAEQVEIEAGRRVQAASDDRFLARRRWREIRDGK